MDEMYKVVLVPYPMVDQAMLLNQMHADGYDFVAPSGPERWIFRKVPNIEGLSAIVPEPVVIPTTAAPISISKPFPSSPHKGGKR